jgi:hypothetical protein
MLQNTGNTLKIKEKQLRKAVPVQYRYFLNGHRYLFFVPVLN